MQHTAVVGVLGSFGTLTDVSVGESTRAGGSLESVCGETNLGMFSCLLL